MHVCVRVVLLTILAGASLAGCDSVDGFGDVTNAFVGGKMPVGPAGPVVASRMTEPVPVEIETKDAPQQSLQKPTLRPKASRKKLPGKKRKALRRQAPALAVPWPQAKPPSLSTQAPQVRTSPKLVPQNFRSQVLRSQYQLRTLWPAPPAPGTFSR
jgi:hypothetical protein